MFVYIIFPRFPDVEETHFALFLSHKYFIRVRGRQTSPQEILTAKKIVDGDYEEKRP
jgi:hypothetical protein